MHNRSFFFFFIAQKENKDYILLANMCLLEYTQMTLFVEFSAEDSLSYIPNKIVILGKVSFQSDQITAASWSGNTCQPSNQLIITLIRLLFDHDSQKTFFLS